MIGSRVIAGSSLEVRSALEAHIEAGEGITVAESLVRSTVAGCETLLVRCRGGIVGGMVNAVRTVETQNLGSRLGSMTVVRLDLRPQQLVAAAERRRSGGGTRWPRRTRSCNTSPPCSPRRPARRRGSSSRRSRPHSGT